MDRRDTVLALLALSIASVPVTSLAQQKDRPWRVGIVWAGTRLTSQSYEEAFLARMTEHGYEVDRKLIVDSRYAAANPARYPALVDEIMALKPDVLIGANTGVARDMKSKTATIPIVAQMTSRSSSHNWLDSDRRKCRRERRSDGDAPLPR